MYDLYFPYLKIKYSLSRCVGLPKWLGAKESTCQAGDLGSIPRLGRFPGEGNANSLQCSCLGNPMDRGGWWAAISGVAKSRT